MRFFKSICFFFIGFCSGIISMLYFYPMRDASQSIGEEKDSLMENFIEVSNIPETLCADTRYVLEEKDLLNGQTVETVWKLPDKYIGMDRETFVSAMETYEFSPPLKELERGFENLEVLSFSREQVTVQMNYKFAEAKTSFYLAVLDHEVIVYLEDKRTIYLHTGIMLEDLPDRLQLEIIQMYFMENEEELYDFLEAYSS